MADTKIRFQAEGLQGIHSDMSILVQDARNLSSIFEESSSRVVEQLREQIKLLKERNSLSGQNINSTTSSSVSPSMNMDDFKYSLRDLTSKIDEFIEIIRSEGLKLNDATIEGLKGTTSQNVTGTREPSMSDTSKFWSGYARSSMFSAINAGFSSMADAISAENPFLYEQQRNRTIGSTISGLTAPLAMLGPYGMLAALLGTAVGGFINLQSAENEQGYKQIASSDRSRSRMARLLGGNPGDYLSYARDLKGYVYGLKNEEALSLSAEAILSSGNILDKESLNRILGSTRAFDISSSDISSLIRSQRGSGQDSIVTLGRLFGGLQSAGLSSSEANIQIAEYLKILVGLNQSQLDTLGEINQEGNMDLLMRLTAVTGPGQANRVGRISQNFDQSISSPRSPQIQAAIYQAIKEVNPNASYLDVRRIQDEGLAANPEVAKSLMEVISRISGENYDQTILNMQGFFGGKIQDNEALYQAYFGKGNRSFENIAKSLTPDQIATKGKQQTSILAQADATEEQAKIVQYGRNILEKVSDALATSIENAKLTDALDSLSSEIDSYSKAIRKSRQNIENKDFWARERQDYHAAHGSGMF